MNLTGLRRMDLLRQAEAAECGLASVGMVASYFGYRTDLSTLRREHAISLKGATLKDIIDIAGKILMPEVLFGKQRKFEGCCLIADFMKTKPAC